MNVTYGSTFVSLSSFNRCFVFFTFFCIPPSIVSAKLRQAERSWTFREQGQHQRQARVDSLTQCRDIKSQLLQTKHSFRLDCFNPEDHRSVTEWVLKAGVWQTIKPLRCNAFKTADRPPGCMVRSSTAPCYVRKLFSRIRRTNTLQSKKKGAIKFGAAARISWRSFKVPVGSVFVQQQS